jgi:ABC-type uncharacterized transport system ATPase subunit
MAPASGLRLEEVTKRFPGVLACDQVSLGVAPGECLALVGENGAGKSTLMNLLVGLYQPDGGRLTLDGQPVRFRSPAESAARGIGMVHQHFMLVPSLTVAENVALGLGARPDERSRARNFDLKRVRAKILEVSAKYGLPVVPDAPVWSLSVGEQQRVELVKTLCLGAKYLILDEPTSALTPQETEDLLRLLNRMKGELALVFISHKLAEVKALADRVAILRHGKVVYEGPQGERSSAELAALMTGKEVNLPRNEDLPLVAEPSLVLRNLSVRGDRGHLALEGLNLDLCPGEILGLAGVAGNGQRELADVLAGLRPKESGTVHLGGLELTALDPRRIIEAGVGYIPEDRHYEGIVPGFSIRENLVLKDIGNAPFSRGGFLSPKAISDHATALRDRFDIRAAGVHVAAGGLSGGNIQKVILARELTRNPRALVAVYPTRGLDLGAIEFVHRRLLDLKRAGCAILLISEELDELTNLCDRIAVLCGELVDTVPARTATRRSLGLLMAGLTEEAV